MCLLNQDRVAPKIGGFLLLPGLYSAPLFFSETLGENKDVSKGITDVKLFEAPGLRLDLRRNNHIGCQILLVQGLDITHSDPERPVASRRLIRGVEMELHPISFNYHKPLLLMCAGKADSPIKGLGLLRIAHGDTRNDCMNDWLARWCGCHVVLFLSYDGMLAWSNAVFPPPETWAWGGEGRRIIVLIPRGQAYSRCPGGKTAVIGNLVSAD